MKNKYISFLRLLLILLCCGTMASGQGVGDPFFVSHPVGGGGGGPVSPALITSYAGGTDNAYYFGGTGDGPTSPTLIVYPKLALVGGSNNCGVLVFAYNSAYSITSVTDSASVSWTAGPTVSDANATTMAMYYVLGDTAGVSKITVVFSGTPGTGTPMMYFSPWLQEFENCGGTIGGNGTLDTAATGSALTLTLSAAPSSGDMALGYFLDTNGGPGNTTGNGLPYDTTITVGSGFTLMSKQLSFGKTSEMDTSTTSTAVTVTYSGSNKILGLGIVIKKGLAGTNPPGTKYIDHYETEQVTSATPTIYFPCSGNLIVGMWSTGNSSSTISSITGSTGSWNVGPSDNNVNVAGVPYGTNATCASTTTVSPTLGATNSSGAVMAMASVTNALSSPFDTSTSGHGTQSTAATLATTAITPGANGEIVFSLTSVSWHTFKGVVADGNSHTPTLLTSTDSAADDANNTCTTTTPTSTLDEDNGFAFFQNVSDHTAITFTYDGTQHTGSCTTKPTGAGAWDTASAAFK